MNLPTHGRFNYSPLPKRPDYNWPGGKRLAMYVAVNVETFGFGMEIGTVLGSALPPPDHRNWSWREYGNRVGFWRLLELFDQFKIPAAHLVNSYLYNTYPEIMQAIRERGDEFVGHGRTNSERPGARPEQDERALIAEATGAILSHEGHPPSGWMTPLMAQSKVSLDLLKEAGYRYVLDWPCDDQPIWMNTRAGPLLSIRDGLGNQSQLAAKTDLDPARRNLSQRQRTEAGCDKGSRTGARDVGMGLRS